MQRTHLGNQKFDQLFSEDGGTILNSQEKKKFLQQYCTAEQEEQRLDREIQRWKSRVQRTNFDYHTLQFPASHDSTLEYAVQQIKNMTIQLILQRSKLVALRQSIGAAINSLSDSRLRELLRLRYIEGMTWEAISEYMNYSYMQINRLHNKALTELNM